MDPKFVQGLAGLQAKGSEEIDAATTGLVTGLSKTVATSSLKAANAISNKYAQMFDDLAVAAKHSADMTHKLVDFAGRFRPMNLAALQYVLRLKVFAQSVREDKIPSMQAALMENTPEIEQVAGVVDEITEEFLPIVELFIQVKDGYGALANEANQLSVEAQLLSNESAKQHTTGEKAQAVGTGALLFSGAGAAGVGACIIGNGSIAAWALAPACAVIGPPGWIALVGAGAVGGAAAVIGGGLAKDVHKGVMDDMGKVYGVMNEIITLVNDHCKELETICVYLQKMKQDTSILDKAMKQAMAYDQSGRSTKLPIQRAVRQLDLVVEDCKVLEGHCDTYVETEKKGQRGVWKIAHGA